MPRRRRPDPARLARLLANSEIEDKRERREHAMRIALEIEQQMEAAQRRRADREAARNRAYLHVADADEPDEGEGDFGTVRVLR